MELLTIAEHTFDNSILRKGANILDLGCRNFEWTNYFDQRGDYVVPVDIDILKTDRPYLRYAVTNYNGTASIKRTSDPQATSISRLMLPNSEQVEAVTLDKLNQIAGVSYWDLIKMDIEKSEKEVILSMSKPMAKQISVEFHRHLGQTELEVKVIVAHLVGLGYLVASHELTEAHGAGKNYWSSLFILK